MDFLKCSYVNTWGLMYLCDVYNTDEKNIPWNFYLKTTDWDSLKPNSKIYIGLEYLTIFVCFFLYKIKVPFILVTGHGDPDVMMGNINLFNKLINCEFLVKWYSQNCIYSNFDKLVHIPIGLDYHTMATISNHAWGSKCSPTTQEYIIKKIKNNSIPTCNRLLKCFANFHFNKDNIRYSMERYDAIKQIPKSLIDYQEHFEEREKTWLEQVRYMFVVSPHGNGIDCHRTWEALVLGCYPIVKRSGICSLFDDLPVIIIDDWSEITEDLLKQKQQEFEKYHNCFNYDKLTLQYWKNIIQ